MEKRISFTAVDNGLTATMAKFQQKSKELSVNLLEDSRNYTTSGREQLKYLQEQIGQQERRNQLDKEFEKFKITQRMDTAIDNAPSFQKEGIQASYAKQLSNVDAEDKEEDIMISLLREQIETLKMVSKEEIAEDKKDVLKQIKIFEKLEQGGQLGSMSVEDIAKRRYQRDLLQRDQDKTGGGMGAGAVFTGALGAMMMQNMMKGLSTLPSAQTGLEAIPLMAGMGAAISAGAITKVADGLIGAIPGVANPNLTLPAMFTAQQGGEIGGQLYIRHLQTLDQFQRGMNKLMGLTGGEITRDQFGGLQELGLDDIEAMKLLPQVVKAGGFTRDFGVQQMKEMTSGGLQYGLDQDVMMNALRLQRMTGDEDFRMTVGRAAAGGEYGGFDPKDRIGFQGMFKNINTLTEYMSGTVNEVNQDEIAATLLNFNKIGGQFDIRDPRSVGLLQQMNQGLTQNQNQFVQATQFGIAQTMLEPGQGFADAQMMVQQGFMQNPEYLKRTLQTLEARGGGEQYMRTAIAQEFGLQGNLAAAKTIYDNMEGLLSGSVTADDIGAFKDQMPDSTPFVKAGEDFVTVLEKSQTRITNSFVTGYKEGTLEIVDHYKKHMKEAIEEIIGLLVLGDSTSTPKEVRQDNAVKAYKEGDLTLEERIKRGREVNESYGINQYGSKM